MTQYFTHLMIFSILGWVAIMYAAVDSRGIEMQPIRDASPWFIGFFVIFNFFGAFLIVNIFVGVIFISYDEIRKESPSAGGALYFFLSIFYD